ncbi:MAG: ComF family protein [Deltaproteobacteria bacterium]|jgi:ComF family protein
MNLVERSPWGWLKHSACSILEFFLPRLCLFCGAAVGEEAKVAVCPECEGQIEWVESPLCTCCGKVFPSRDGADRVCGDCQKDPPPFARARAAAVYDGPAAQAIKRFKFNRQMANLPVMQHWLQHLLCLELVADAGLIIPVPLHPRRLKQRGFNQALLLAKAFPQVPVSRDAVVRVKDTVPQVELKPKERRDNVKGAFAVPEPALVKGKNVLLLDDVYTTGATVRECAKVLLRAGARRVEVLTVARVKPG